MFRDEKIHIYGCILAARCCLGLYLGNQYLYFVKMIVYTFAYVRELGCRANNGFMISGILIEWQEHEHNRTVFVLKGTDESRYIRKRTNLGSALILVWP